jgi:hypothetical protein
MSLPTTQPPGNTLPSEPSQDTLAGLRAALFDTLRQVKAKSLDLETARGVNDLAKTLIDTAKVEVDYLRLTGENGSHFIDPGMAQLQGPQQ